MSADSWGDPLWRTALWFRVGGRPTFNTGELGKDIIMDTKKIAKTGLKLAVVYAVAKKLGLDKELADVKEQAKSFLEKGLNAKL
jgi:hypothetical protein